MEPLCPESVIVARHDLLHFLLVHHLYQPLTATHVVADGAVGQPVDHGPVVDHVSTEQHLVVLVVKTDAAPGMTWHVEYRQLPIPEVNDVT